MVWVWVVVAGGAGTVSHRGRCVDFTLTFDSSPIKGEGYMVGVVLLTGVTLLPLWIADQVRNDGPGLAG